MQKFHQLLLKHLHRVIVTNLIPYLNISTMKKIFFIVLLCCPFVIKGQTNQPPINSQELNDVLNIKLEQLKDNIMFIVGDNHEGEKNTRINETVLLFVNGSIFQEQSAGKKIPKTRNVSNYLNTIRNRGKNYKLKIYFINTTTPTTENFQYSSACDCFSGSVRLYQVYEITMRDGAIRTKIINDYTDTTEKIVQIVLKKARIVEEGNTSYYWDIFLGNVTVDRVYQN